TEKLAAEEVTVFTGLPPGRLYCIERDGTFVIATSKPIMETVVANLGGAGLEKSLADVEKYNTTMNRCFGQGDEQPQISWFVDPIAIIRRQATGWLSAGLALFPALGLDGLEAVGGTMTFSTGEFRSEERRVGKEWRAGCAG